MVKPGDYVEQGQPLVIVHGNSEKQVAKTVAPVTRCYKIGHKKKEPLPLIYGQVNN
jgi:thymidine phosphorylase